MKEIKLKDKYSKTVEIEEGSVVQVTEYIDDTLLITTAYPDKNTLQSKAIMLTEDEVFAINSILNEWTKQRQH